MSELPVPEFDQPEIDPVEEPGYNHMLDHLIYIQQALREMELEGEAVAAA
jgi:hypothetical protein